MSDESTNDLDRANTSTNDLPVNTDLERRKLELEILELQRPFFHRQSFWFGLIPLAIAIPAVVYQWASYGLDVREATLEVDRAEHRADVAEARLADVDRKRKAAQAAEVAALRSKDDAVEDTKVAQEELSRIKKTQRVVLADLRIAAEITAGGGSILVTEGEIPQVDGVDLSRGYSDGIFQKMTQLSRLRTLVAPGTIDDRFFERLKSFKDLESLDLSRTDKITEMGIQHLVTLPNLTHLAIRNDFVKRLKLFPGLESLSIENTNPNHISISDTDFSENHNVERLVFAGLVREDPITGTDDLGALRSLVKLKYLEFGAAWSGVGINLASPRMETLAELKQLQKLVITNSSTSEDDLKRIQQILPEDCEIVILRVL